jgi:cytochrome b subunit of formate dehydrogenase
MDKAKDIKEELLKQMNGYTVEIKEVSSSSAWKIVEKHKARIRLQKWIAAISWFITFLYAVAMHNLKLYLSQFNTEDLLTREEFQIIRFSDICLAVVIIISILLTYLVYAKSKTLTMLQICARLASIEEHLKKIAQDKSPASET